MKKGKSFNYLFLKRSQLYGRMNVSKFEIQLSFKRKMFPLEIAFEKIIILISRLFVLSHIFTRDFVSLRKKRKERYVFSVDFQVIIDEVFENTLASLRILTSDIQIFHGLGFLLVIRLTAKVLFWPRFWDSFCHFFIF